MKREVSDDWSMTSSTSPKSKPRATVDIRHPTGRHAIETKRFREKPTSGREQLEPLLDPRNIMLAAKYRGIPEASRPPWPAYSLFLNHQVSIPYIFHTILNPRGTQVAIEQNRLGGDRQQGGCRYGLMVLSNILKSWSQRNGKITKTGLRQQKRGLITSGSAGGHQERTRRSL